DTVHALGKIRAAEMRDKLSDRWADSLDSLIPRWKDLVSFGPLTLSWKSCMQASVPRVWLLAEDDENDFILLKRALRRAEPKATLHWVRDGTEANEYLLRENRFSDRARSPLPSVILSDLNMPRCSGLELVQWVRQQGRFTTLPFIIFSASDQASDVDSAYQD